MSEKKLFSQCREKSPRTLVVFASPEVMAKPACNALSRKFKDTQMIPEAGSESYTDAQKRLVAQEGYFSSDYDEDVAKRLAATLYLPSSLPEAAEAEMRRLEPQFRQMTERTRRVTGNKSYDARAHFWHDGVNVNKYWGLTPNSILSGCF